MPLSRPISVVLPAPLGPTSAMCSPCSIRSSMSARTGIRPNAFVTFRNRNAGSAGNELPRAGIHDHADLPADRLDLGVVGVLRGDEAGRAEQIEDDLVRRI